MIFIALSGYGYIGRCRFRLRKNSTNCQPSKVITRKMTEEEMIKYGIKKDGSETKIESQDINMDLK